MKQRMFSSACLLITLFLASVFVTTAALAKDPLTIMAKGGADIRAESGLKVNSRAKPGQLPNNDQLPNNEKVSDEDDDEDEEYEDDEGEDVEIADGSEYENEEVESSGQRHAQNLLLPLESVPGIGESATKVRLPYSVGSTHYFYEFELVGHKLVVRHYATNKFGFNHGEASLAKPKQSVAFNLVGQDLALASDMFAGRHEVSFFLSDPIYSLTIQAQNGPKTVFEDMSVRIINQAMMTPEIGSSFHATHTFGLGTESYTIMKDISEADELSQYLVQNSEGQLAYLVVADPNTPEQMEHIRGQVDGQKQIMERSVMNMHSLFSSPTTGIISHGQNFLIYMHEGLPNLRAVQQATAFEVAASEQANSQSAPLNVEAAMSRVAADLVPGCAAAFSPKSPLAKQ